MIRLEEHIKAFTVFSFLTLGMFASVADEALAKGPCCAANKAVSQKETHSDRSSVPEDPCDTEPTKVKEKESEKGIL